MKSNATNDSRGDPELKKKGVCIYDILRHKGYLNIDGVLDDMAEMVLNFLHVIMVRYLGVEQRCLQFSSGLGGKSLYHEREGKREMLTFKEGYTSHSTIFQLLGWFVNFQTKKL